MLIVVSPAKSLNLDPIDIKKVSKPRFNDEIKGLVAVMKKKSKTDLKKLMSISEKLAMLNAERYQKFEFPFTKKNAKPAIFSFNGDVYRGLDIAQFNAQDIDYAQDHFRILSGLYGLMRPLDLMQPYRLEMGTKLTINGHKNLYEFWGDKISDMINKDMKKNGDEILVNLASEEYFKSVDQNKLKYPILDIEFKELRGDQLKIISFSAKKARGMMSRFIIKNQITNLKDLEAFSEEKYRFHKSLSSEQKLVFTR